MKHWIKKKIQTKLKNYKTTLNQPNTNLPFALQTSKKVAVIGGGIAGLSASANLAERGFEVTLLEKNNYLGGKLGSWSFESKGETLQVEHGFHAFFRQYYNLRNFMKKIGVYKHLIPIDDYLILLQNQNALGFKNIDQTPVLNILDLRKKGVFGWKTIVNPLSIKLLDLLKYDANKTYAKYDHVSFSKFAKQTLLPKTMQIVFNSFTRAFFAAPEQMSMAELIKGFHFYFLSNEDGLLYDVLNDDFSTTFLEPCKKYIEQHNGKIELNSAIDQIVYENNQFKINNETYDYCVLATDCKSIKTIVQQSQTLQSYSTFANQIKQLKTSNRYAVWRIWTNVLEQQKELPFFIFTDRLQCLDSVTLYHKMEKTSAAWSEQNNGGIFELHCYSLPDDLQTAQEIKAAFLEELSYYFPELSNFNIVHEFFQLRDDFPAFHINQYQNRPSITTAVPNLFLAGDWVKIPNPSMLMEAAYTSGAIAANEILKQEGLQEHPLYTVATKGLLA